VHGHLKNQGRAFAYREYQRQSALVHGSTLEGSIRLVTTASGEAVAVPILTGDSDEVEAEVSAIVTAVNTASIALNIVRSRVWDLPA